MADLKRKLKDQLSCSICRGTYKDPRLLKCNHIYCRDCLAGLAGPNLTCPNCRKVTSLPACGVEGLTKEFRTNNFLEILSEHKKMKLDVYCPQHEDRELELYCNQCKDRICFQCTMQQHKGHDYDLISEILKPVENTLKTLSSLSKEVTDKQVAIKAQINESSQQLHEIIDLRKTKLITKLNGITQEKLSELASQREKVEITQAQVNSVLDNVKENVRTGNEGVQNNLIDQVKDLTAVFQSELINTKANMTFSFSHAHAAVEACHAHGLVSAPEIPEPAQCHALSAVPDVTTVGEKYTTLIQVNTHEGKRLVHSLECELVSELTGTKAKVSVERKEQGQYEVSYKPTIKGRHKLHIKLMGEHIKESPFSVAAKSPVEKLGSAIKSINGLKSPVDIAISQSGEVVVAEYEGRCVSLYSPSGKRLQSFGTRVSSQGLFANPHGVAVDGEGNILVVDSWNNRIQKFTADGQFITAVGTEGSGSLEFDCMRGIAFNPSNNQIYVSDRDNHRIQILNSDLTFSSTFGKFGKGEGEFKKPTGIACDSTGNVYVADFGGNRIQVFTSTGKFLRMFGSYGEGRGELSRPMHIALDVADNVYISECWNHCISVFNSEDQFVLSFGSKGKEPGEFEYPRGIAVDSNGVVYVCDNNGFQLF